MENWKTNTAVFKICRCPGCRPIPFTHQIQARGTCWYNQNTIEQFWENNEKHKSTYPFSNNQQTNLPWPVPEKTLNGNNSLNPTTIKFLHFSISKSHWEFTISELDNLSDIHWWQLHQQYGRLECRTDATQSGSRASSTDPSRHKKYVNSFVVWKQISFHTDSEWVLHHANSLRVANKTCFSKFEIWNSKFEIITLFPIILKAGRRKLFAKTIDRISWIFGKSDQWF